PPRFLGTGMARRPIVSGGCTVDGDVERSVLSVDCHVPEGARLEQAVVLPGVAMGHGRRGHRDVIDSGCRIPPGTVIGAESSSAARSHYVSPNGVVLVTAEALEAAAVNHLARIA